MKRLISIILTIALLCTPVCGFSLEDLPEIPKEIFEKLDLEGATQDLISDLQAAKEAIKAMSDEELETFIREKAAQYHIPEMNEEQIKFLMDICRSFETAEQFGETIKGYQEKAEGMGDTIAKLMDTLTGILDTLTGLLDSLESLFGLMNSEE